MATEDNKKNIVIIGGGIIGCTSAYFLTRHPSFDPAKHTITLLEATKIAGGASGKAGGLLALWAYPSNIVPLSYRLHAELAKEHGGAERWEYRRIHCGQLDAKGRPLIAKSKSGVNGTNGTKESISLQKRDQKAIGTLRAAGVPKELDWIAPDTILGYDEMGGPDTTAQVHPYLFTTAMASLAEQAGAKVILGSATHIDRSAPDGGVTGVTYADKTSGAETTIPATDVVIAAGPWTSQLYPPAPISALRAHSVTIRPSRPVSAYALFTSIQLPRAFGSGKAESQRRTTASTQTVTPEIYARPHNEVYACGEGDTLIELPRASDLVQVDEQRCQDIVDYVASVSDELAEGEVTARQACYLPNVRARGAAGPLVGPTGVRGLWLAAGHTCWGIQNGPGTGKVVSEFVFEGAATSARVESLDPRRVLE